MRFVRVAAIVLVTFTLSAGAAAATPAERPIRGVEPFVKLSQVAARRAQLARAVATRLSGSACAAFAPAAARLTAAASDAEAVFEEYRKANTRYGTGEEIKLLAGLNVDLHEALGQLSRAAGETTVAPQAEQQAAEREVSLLRNRVETEVQERLEAAGLADVLTSSSLAKARAAVVAKLQQRLRARADAELKRLVGLRIRLNVPLRKQIHDVLKRELETALLPKLGIVAGPVTGIVIRLLRVKIFSVIGPKLKEALRKKGNLERRAAKTIRGFANREKELESLGEDTTLDRVSRVRGRAERALGATKFLESDLRRAHDSELLGKLLEAKASLGKALEDAPDIARLDSDLLRDGFKEAIRQAAAVRADVERLSKKLGCQTAKPSQPSAGCAVALATVSGKPGVSGQLTISRGKDSRGRPILVANGSISGADGAGKQGRAVKWRWTEAGTDPDSGNPADHFVGKSILSTQEGRPEYSGSPTTLENESGPFEIDTVKHPRPWTITIEVAAYDDMGNPVFGTVIRGTCK